MLLPGRQLLHLDVGADQEKRGRQIIPYRDAAKERQVQIVGQRIFSNVSQDRVWPGPQELAIGAFDRDRVRLKRAAFFATADTDEAYRLPSGGSFRNDLLEVAAVPGLGEQCPSD